jgi:hypothetical protein
MASMVCGRCENRHVIETLGARTFLAAMQENAATARSSFFSSRTSLEILRAQNAPVPAPLALPAPRRLSDIVEQLLRPHHQQER